MNVRRILRGALVITGAAALAAGVSVGQAQAEPRGPAEMITMVNGAGKTVSIPKAVLSATGASSAANLGKAPAPATADDKGGDLGTNTVIGPDGRVQESNPGGSPWRAIVHLSSNQGGCTGFMLSRDVVVTAGHCVYDVAHGWGWVTSYTATPGKVGGANPWGSCSGGINDVWTTGNWANTGSPDYDYGLIKLTCDIGNTTGWFGWWYNMGENLVNQTFYVEGYPGDKPYGTMWWDSDLTTAQSATRLFYWIDTAPGQSGSPVYRYNSVCGGWCVTAIHTTGVWDTPYNSGTRFNPDVMSFINYWINQP